MVAVLAADMVGFSRLMEGDEEGTLTRQKRYFDELIGPAILREHGRIVKLTGDGLIAEFASVVDAVRCAVAIQRKMAELEASEPEARAIRYRMAVNLGDVIFDGDEIYGDGVNIAARLEGLAEPGGVVISGTAYDHLKSNVDVRYDDLGEQQLKNISTPVRVYRVVDRPEDVGAVYSRHRHRWPWFAAATALLLVAGANWWMLIVPSDSDGAGSVAELKALP
ncbi:MAG: adenylate/guanylate cyclase domain-containing protein, partial [Rhizobiaceae bacterium]